MIALDAQPAIIALHEPPVIERNVCGSSPFLLTCDHYGG
ncbi:N-formylglutamate amidohydrolase [Nitrobacter sp. Nb-311A]|nr:N-formylglutamate amidohydrolase [Nitrobacter sp. Nb-311A]